MQSSVPVVINNLLIYFIYVKFQKQAVLTQEYNVVYSVWPKELRSVGHRNEESKNLRVLNGSSHHGPLSQEGGTSSISVQIFLHGHANHTINLADKFFKNI
jgi:hypothetical protein